MRRPKSKTWPRSWKQVAAVGGTLTLKGRSFEHEFVVMTARVEASTPEQFEERTDEAIVELAKSQRPS